MTEQRVSNGVELLDFYIPDWRSLIDWDTLRMENPCNCVLGQLFKSYWWNPFFTKWNEAVEYGFTCRPGFPKEWDLLTEEWRKA
jgi:hypothetical protein